MEHPEASNGIRILYKLRIASVVMPKADIPVIAAQSVLVSAPPAPLIVLLGCRAALTFGSWIYKKQTVQVSS